MKTEHTEYAMKNLAAERDHLKAVNAEMLEALKSIELLLDCGNREESHVDDALTEARAAIAKAEGGKNS